MNATASVWTHGLRLQIALIAVLSVAAIGWPAWDAYSDLRVIEHGQPIDDHMQEVGASIVRLDELMSVAAHMASARGDPKWEVAYRAAEPKLDRAIDEGQRLQVGAPPGTAAARLDTANNSLVAMEHQAFEAVRQGRRVDAERLLSNDSHEFQREQFAKGMAEYNANLSRAQDQVQASFVHSKRTDAAKTIASIALLVIGIFLMLRSTRRWQAAVVASNRLLNANALELQEFNEQLDVKVRERTKDLTDSAIASLNMMEDVVRHSKETAQAHKDLDFLASYDTLTGLANRNLFLKRVQARLQQRGETAMQALFKIDILRFRSINDALGRNAGDDLLRQAAERLVNTGGADPSRFARVGADRFAVVADVEGGEQAGRYAALRLEEVFGPPFKVGDADIHLQVSAGIALFPDDGVDAETLARNAEAALKKAKQSGDRFLFFNQAMTERVAERLALEQRLREAIDREEFVLHYQPKFNGSTGKLTSAEALIRWNDPKNGLVPPDLFIPILEETGLIGEVGRWAMHKAIADYLHWCDQGLPGVRIAVNVSALQLRNHDFVAEIRHALAFDPRAAEGLELEITESMLMNDMQQAVVTLQAIRTLGVSVAIDDFGTGFSSLGYLSKLPVDTLKIDRSFVNDMTADPQGLALVSTIINLAHSLRLKVVAEGVETEEQAQLLRLLRCDELQGYLFGKPVARAEFESRHLGVVLAA